MGLEELGGLEGRMGVSDSLEARAEQLLFFSLLGKLQYRVELYMGAAAAAAAPFPATNIQTEPIHRAVVAVVAVPRTEAVVLAALELTDLDRLDRLAASLLVEPVGSVVAVGRLLMAHLEEVWERLDSRTTAAPAAAREVQSRAHRQ
jgi:hypothetical protein